MSSLLPIRSEPSTGGQEPRVVDLEGEDAEQVFSALSSSTARRIVAELHEEPSAQSEIAEELDTTVQNVRYHLDKLEDAGLVEVVDTWYSSRGNEMKVYAPADGALIVSGDEGTASRLRTALSRLVGGVAILGMASLLLQTLIDRFGPTVSQDAVDFGGEGGGGADGGVPAGGGDGGDGGGAPATTEAGGQGDQYTDGGVTRTVEEGTTEVTTTADVETTLSETRTAIETQTQTATDATRTAAPTGTPTQTATATETTKATATATETVEATATEPTTSAADGGVNLTTTLTETVTDTAVDPTSAPEAAGGLPPGALFFLGGVSVLVVVTGIWYLSGR